MRPVVSSGDSNSFESCSRNIGRVKLHPITFRTDRPLRPGIGSLVSFDGSVAAWLTEPQPRDSSDL